MWTIFALIFLTLCAGVAGWLFFIWAVKSGQFEDIEGPKYRMLDDSDIDSKKDSKNNKTLQ
ncbi:cbb3-type cytochrome oxidase assembly protein CcoS [Nitrospirota bacterium]